LLRNPAVLAKPLSAPKAAEMCEALSRESALAGDWFPLDTELFTTSVGRPCVRGDSLAGEPMIRDRSLDAPRWPNCCTSTRCPQFWGAWS